MFSDIILTIILILLLIIVSSVIYWWFKHGKELFSTIKNLMKSIPKNPTQQMNNGVKDIKNLFDMLQKMDDSYKNMKK